MYTPLSCVPCAFPCSLAVLTCVAPGARSTGARTWTLLSHSSGVFGATRGWWVTAVASGWDACGMAHLRWGTSMGRAETGKVACTSSRIGSQPYWQP